MGNAPVKYQTGAYFLHTCSLGMWTYRQATGNLLHDGQYIGRGYQVLQSISLSVGHSTPHPEISA